MAQSSCGAALAFEAFDEFFIAHKLRRDQLQGDVTIGAEMGREIDGAHTAHTEKPLKTILLVEDLADVCFKWRHCERPVFLNPRRLSLGHNAMRNNPARFIGLAREAS